MVFFPLCHSPVLCSPLSEGKIPYLGEVGTEEFIMKLTSQITEMVSAKISQGKSIDHYGHLCLYSKAFNCKTVICWKVK